MRSTLALAALTLALFGCRTPNSASSLRDDEELGNGGFNAECAQEFAMVCPEGQQDSCLKHPAAAPRRCVAKNWNGQTSGTCMQEILIICDEGQIDSCVIDPSGTRKCVPTSWSPAGGGQAEQGGQFNPECAQEIALVCPEGQQDSCIKHNTSAPRRCVAKSWNGQASSTCMQEIAIVCPAGQVDSCTIDPSGGRKCVAKSWTPQQQAGGGGQGGGQFNPQCAQEFAMVCPTGQEDSCLKHNSSAPRRCVAKTWNGTIGQSCMQEIAIVCDGGKVDSCTIDPSKPRKCVPKSWAP